MAYLSWSFLKMGEKAERRTAFLFLLMAGVPVLIVAFFAFVAGMAAILYAGPVLALMLLPFYLPCALRKEKTRNACSRNILFGREPLTVSFRMIVKNWVYVIYAVFPALPFLFPGGNMPLDGQGNGRNLTAFFLMWISLYSVFAVLAVFLGKAPYLKPGGVMLAAGANLALMLVYCLREGAHEAFRKFPPGYSFRLYWEG